jgi:hypothetical protein
VQSPALPDEEEDDVGAGEMVGAAMDGEGAGVGAGVLAGGARVGL